MTTSTGQAPSELAVYRDDGPLAALGTERFPSRKSKLGWLLPPVLRAVEYGALLALTLAVQPEALPKCFALLSALAFHHYDTVYRLRHQRVAPPRWIGIVGGGWALRLVLAAVLAALGWLGAGMLIAAIVLGALFVGESVVSWWRFSQPASMYENEEDEQE